MPLPDFLKHFIRYVWGQSRRYFHLIDLFQMLQACQGTESRGEARAKLRDDIDAIFGVARTMGVETEFQRPTANNDEALLHAARSFATNALPLKAQFIAHEMPEDFLDELNADINALAAAIVAQGNAVGDHMAASAAVDERSIAVWK